MRQKKNEFHATKKFIAVPEECASFSRPEPNYSSPCVSNPFL
jgi:hypothetical protein